MWKSKKWQDRKNTVERTQQLKCMFITADQKSSLSVHAEGITEQKKSCNFGVLHNGMYQVAVWEISAYEIFSSMC